MPRAYADFLGQNAWHLMRITEARRFVPGPNSGIDSVPRSMDNRSRRPVDFRYMASARKAPPD